MNEDGTEYISSEDLTRHIQAKEAFIQAEKKKKPVVSETDRLKGILDRYIAKHSKTTSVRKLAGESKKVEKYGADYQLDLSADIVETLEKIKSDLR